MAQPRSISFSDLPTEMVANIFTFIRCKADMKAISLVSRAWCDVVGPSLWEQLVIDFRPSSTRTMATLLNPQSSIYLHVRGIHIKDAAKDLEGESRVQLFISNLPPDRLKRFASNRPISLMTFQLLLKSYRQLQYILTRLRSQDATVSDDTVASIRSYPWASSLLSDVTQYAFFVPVDSQVTPKDSKEFEFVLRTMSKMRTLHFKLDSPKTSIKPEDTAKLSLYLPQEVCEYRFARLAQLFFSEMNLNTCSQKLVRYLDFEELYHLRLYECQDSGPFLSGLCEALERESGYLTKLQIFHPYNMANGPETQQAVQNFLKRTHGLRCLELDVGTHGLVSKECFFPHVRTLHTLILGTGQSLGTQYYSVQDLKDILGRCPRLRNLAINMPPVHLGSLMDLATDFRLGSGRFATTHVVTEFESTLELLASHKPLHTFRILNRPHIDYTTTIPAPTCLDLAHITDQEAKLCQFLMQNFANELVRYMSRANSRLRVFSSSPSFTPIKRPAADTNGHSWPAYTYIMRRMMPGAGVEEVVAAPLACAEAEMPGNSVLSYGF